MHYSQLSLAYIAVELLCVEPSLMRLKHLGQLV